MTAVGEDARHLSTARVLRVEQHACEVVDAVGTTSTVRFAPAMPTPRRERVSPGHLVAVAGAAGASPAVVWRWYDAVVLGPAVDRALRLWEPAHGEVVARARPSCPGLTPGSRAWASAGLPGADWWVTGGTDGAPDVELAEVDALYAEHGLWSSVFDDEPAKGR